MDIMDLKKQSVINALCHWYTSRPLGDLARAIMVAERAIDRGESSWRALHRAYEHMDRLAVDRAENYRASELLRRNIMRLRSWQKKRMRGDND